MPELQLIHLSYLIAVAETGSITRSSTGVLRVSDAGCDVAVALAAAREYERDSGIAEFTRGRLIG